MTVVIARPANITELHDGHQSHWEGCETGSPVSLTSNSDRAVLLARSPITYPERVKVTHAGT